MIRKAAADRRHAVWLAVLGGAAALLACGAGHLARAGDGAELVIKAGKIIPVVGAPIAPGVIVIRDGRIAAVGPDAAVPAGAKVIDAGNRVVIPGLVAAFTTLAEAGRDVRESATPELRTADGLDAYGDWRSVLAGGVTTVYLSPPGRRLMPGQGAVAKLGSGSPSARVLDDRAALRIVLGEWAKNPPDLWEPPLPPTPEVSHVPPEKQLPTTRMGEIALLRGLFGRAGSTAPEGEQTAVIGSDVLRSALRKDIAVRVRADRAEDIRNALALGEEFGLRTIIEGGTEAYALADELAGQEVPVVLLPPIRPGKRVGADLAQTLVSGRTRADNAALLTRAGVEVAIATADSSLRDLLVVAGAMVGEGLPQDAALRAVTAGAAEVLGVAERAGSIEVGKDADLAILTGEPFATRTVVQTTISDGRIAYERKAPAEGGLSTGEGLRILRARRIITGGGGSVYGGEIRVRDGRIEAVGERLDAPAGAEVIDLGDRVIMPGMIDVQSHLGLHWESEQATLSPQPATSGPTSGGMRFVSIAGAVDPTDAAFGDALRAGVTSVALAPGDAGLFCGTVAVLKTAGRSTEEMIVKPVAALKFSMLGDRDRLARAWQMRDLLEKAQKYDSDWAEFDRRRAEFERRYAADPDKELKEPVRPKRDSQQEALRALFADRVPALVAADRPDEMASAVKVFREEYGLSVAVLGAGEGHRVAADLRGARVAAVVGPEITREERGRTINVAAELARAGVPVAFQSRATSGTRFLRITAAYAVRHGMDATDALRAVTVRPAQILGVDGRIGCIEPGRDADIVVLSGDPLELTSRVEKVFVNGEVAYDAEAEE
ncbi:MAG: amidohydrolase family protein [Armatimonadota bacterium]|jgi:imidazolonepropionase-like amidohydrolase